MAVLRTDPDLTCRCCYSSVDYPRPVYDCEGNRVSNSDFKAFPPTPPRTSIFSTLKWRWCRKGRVWSHPAAVASCPRRCQGGRRNAQIRCPLRGAQRLQSYRAWDEEVEVWIRIAALAVSQLLPSLAAGLHGFIVTIIVIILLLILFLPPPPAPLYFLWYLIACNSYWYCPILFYVIRLACCTDIIYHYDRYIARSKQRNSSKERWFEYGNTKHAPIFWLNLYLDFE